MAMVGTSVRDNTYEASMAKITARQRDEQEFRHACEENMGTNTMQMQSVETSAGTAISCEPSRSRGSVLPLRQVSLDIFNGHRGVVHQDTDRERQAAERHQIDRFVQRAQYRDRDRIESGIEMAMITVLRQLPRNKRIISAVRQAATTPSRRTP